LDAPGHGRGALAVPAQGRPEFGHRAGALKQRRRVVKRGHRFTKQRKAFLPAACQPGGPQRDPERARRAEHPHVSEFGVGQLTRMLALAQPQQRERRARARMHVTRLADWHAPHLGAEQRPRRPESRQVRRRAAPEPVANVRGRPG